MSGKTSGDQDLNFEYFGLGGPTHVRRGPALDPAGLLGRGSAE